jgi:hypothetical protein
LQQTAQLLRRQPSPIAAVLAGSATAYADETPIQMAMEDGKTVAQFKVGDSRCVLQNDLIRCTPVGK